MEHAPPSVGPSYRFHSNGWLVLLTIGLAIQFIVAAAAMVETEMCVAEAGEIVFPHPTVSEALREAIIGVH